VTDDIGWDEHIAAVAANQNAQRSVVMKSEVVQYLVARDIIHIPLKGDTP
jgi:hypothetical protein